MPSSPGFAFMGGKYRIRKWLVDLFPVYGKKIYEPFLGRGNVYFQSRTCLDFEEWHLSDIDVSFFESLRRVNLDLLPEKIDRKDFGLYRNSGCDIAKIIEPRVTFGGKGYSAGFVGEQTIDRRYKKEPYHKLCSEAKRLLEGSIIVERSWEDLDWVNFTQQDFVYLDPPYLGTKACYKNIDHEKLIEVLNKANFRWAISGYASELYENNLKYKNKYFKERNSEIKSSMSKKSEPVLEILWTNYDK